MSLKRDMCARIVPSGGLWSPSTLQGNRREHIKRKQSLLAPTFVGRRALKVTTCIEIWGVWRSVLKRGGCGSFVEMPFAFPTSAK
ncbi:hypothetical protein EVAR_82082_1 [Eumeta japonica]|uniref:Uncharacterized protein n=1 Tax=Eumeta variegata TaxID=151549 RepID=A0A4C1U1P7_EUMVA|nr:hypothetical protein EVAR_82082_1 [Eumeta japonica]